MFCSETHSYFHATFVWETGLFYLFPLIYMRKKQKILHKLRRKSQYKFLKFCEIFKKVLYYS